MTKHEIAELFSELFADRLRRTPDELKPFNAWGKAPLAAFVDTAFWRGKSGK